MLALPTQKTFLQKQIPTLLGLLILVVALAAGLIFFSTGTGVFSPRATPQTTPKNIKITNITDTSFTVSFLTDESTAGFIKYGKEAGSLKSQSSDDRDQLSGSVGKFPLHHITVRGLEPDTAYFYSLGTGSNASFDNNGSPFQIKTAKRGGTPSAAKTIYGSVNTEGGTPADGSIVYVTLAGVGELSSLVKTSGSTALPLSNARLADGSAYATIQDSDSLTITVQGPLANQKSELVTTVGAAQPFGPITLGQNGTATTNAPAVPDSNMSQPDVITTATSAGTTSVSDLVGNTTPPATTASSSATANGLNELITATMSDLASQSAQASTSGTTVYYTLDLEKTVKQTLTTTTPTIVGQAAPGVTVDIEVNSETKITQKLVANADGSFSLDIASLSQELEPGEHTVTYSYTDPATGQKVTKTQTFTVKAGSTATPASTTGTSSQVAQATTKTTTASSSSKTTTTTKTSTSSATPFGSGNPFPVGGATTSSKTATSSTRTTQPSTRSGVPVSGSTGTTVALMLGGLFFLAAALWSYWVAQNIEEQTRA